MYQNLFILTIFAFGYGLVVRKIESSFVSSPIIFVLFGLVIGSYGLDLLDLKPDNDLISNLAEFMLAPVLFTDASMLECKFP